MCGTHIVREKLDFFLKLTQRHELESLLTEQEADMFDLVLGVVLIGLGVLTLLARLFGWESMFWKLEPMKKTYGARIGNLIHISAYGFLPLIVGAIFLSPSVSKLASG